MQNLAWPIMSINCCFLLQSVLCRIVINSDFAMELAFLAHKYDESLSWESLGQCVPACRCVTFYPAISAQVLASCKPGRGLALQMCTVYF